MADDLVVFRKGELEIEHHQVLIKYVASVVFRQHARRATRILYRTTTFCTAETNASPTKYTQISEHLPNFLAQELSDWLHRFNVLFRL